MTKNQAGPTAKPMGGGGWGSASSGNYFCASATCQAKTGLETTDEQL